MNRDALAAQLVVDEGLRLKPYHCTAGKLTIGVGRNLDDRGITKAEALMLLGGDIDAVEADLDRALPWWRGMSDRRQQALANMCFNLGINRLLGFKKALAAMQDGRWSDVAREMLDSRWAYQVGNRARRLAKMMEEG